MKKNKIFAIAMVMVMMFALAACGNKVEDTNNDVKVEDIETSVTEESTVGENTLETEEDMDEAIDANEGETKEETVEPIYEEGTDVVLITNADAWGDEYYDGKEIDMNALTPAGGKGTIGKEISIYNVVKQHIGCLKVGATVEVVTESNEWSYVSVYDGCYVVRTDELDKAMAVATENNSTKPEKESASEKNEENKNTNETTYSVVEMSATKYAKQSVNIRKGPGTDYDKIGSLTMNQKVTVTGQADNGWYRISFNGGDAYVSNKYLVDNKIETNETTTNNGGNSDNGGENNNGSDDTTNNSNTDNGGGNNTPTPEPTPTTPTVDYSASDVVNVIESTLRGAGFQKTTDVMTAEEIAMFGPTAGAGWGDITTTFSEAQESANNLVNFMNVRGYNAFYIEVIGMSNGVVTLRIYNCTF